MNKQVRLGTIISVIVVIAVIVISVVYQNKQDAKIVTEINRNLSDADRQIYQDRITDADRKLAEASTDQLKFDALMQKGFNLYGLGLLGESKVIYLQAADLKKDEITPYVALFQTQLEMNDNDGARQSIEKALQLNSSSADIWKKNIQLEIDRFEINNEQVTELYAEALAKTHNHTDIITSYALWLSEVGNFQASKEYWQRAIEANPGSRDVYQAEIQRLDDLIKTQNAQ